MDGMDGREQTEQALPKLEEVRGVIRRAEVDLRESAYYPFSEARRHPGKLTNSLASAERTLRAVLRALEGP
jgi:hypothetical protein